MKKISDLFTVGEKKQLSYLGSMLRSEPTVEEAEFELMVDAWLKAGILGPGKGAAGLAKDIQAQEQS